MRRAFAIGGVCLLAAGCGSSPQRVAPPVPKLPRALAQRLAGETDAVAAALAAGDSCRATQLASRLRSDMKGSLRQVPARLRAPLARGVDELAAEVPACAPAPAAAPARVPSPQPARGHGHDHPRGRHDHGHHGQGHGHGGDG